MYLEGAHLCSPAGNAAERRGDRLDEAGAQLLRLIGSTDVSRSSLYQPGCDLTTQTCSSGSGCV